jgi:LEA14-like dessication related protein
MRPARAWNVTIHGEGLPLHLVKVEQADVVQGNVLCSREYLVVSSTIDNEEEMLIPVSEYSRRVHDTWAGRPP